MTITEVVSALTELGVMPVISLGALVGIAAVVYKRFRR